MAENPAKILNASVLGNTASFQRDGKSVSELRDAARRCGYTPDGGVVPDQYLVKILNLDPDSENPVQSMVVAVLQERVNFTVGSNWKNFIPDNFKNADLVNLAFQTFLKSSSQNAFSSRQIWSGTSPIRMNLQLKFQAVGDNTYREVVQPCEVLQEIALPGRGPLGFLRPPGPNPTFSEFLTNWAEKRSINSQVAVDYFAGGGVQTYVQIGTMLTFPSVIVKSVEVDFDSRVTKEGLPISSLVKIGFDTYQIYTKEDLRSAYSVGGQP